MTLRVTFGIDPGMSGAVAALIDGEAGPILDMPTMTVGKKQEVDARAIAVFIREIRSQHPGAVFAGCVERVRAMPPKDGRQAGAQSSMNFGESYAKAKTVLEVMGIPFSLAEPASWKRHFGLIGQDKEASRQLAIRRFPSAAPHLTLKKHSDRAEALLMALWHEQKHQPGALAA
ncbi:crossover junction endodeoxyribonuclease RuvC [Xanthomonas campestris]